MSNKQSEIERILRSLPYPGFGRDLVSLGVVQRLELDDGFLRISIGELHGDAAPREEIETLIRNALQGVSGIGEIRFHDADADGAAALRMATPAKKPSAAAAGGVDNELIPGVSHVVAVASGKGGVGKSTVSVNLAVGLARQGLRVGLLDADIYGPSIPILFGLAGAEPKMDRESRKLIPFHKFGVTFMSLGFLVAADSAVIWRGPMVMKALEQLLRDVDWGDLDVLVLDMPPGTGDAQLTLSQRLQLSGAVIVTTPQDLALADAVKGVAMFGKVGVEILGIVENMSYHRCSHCGEREEIFGHGGGKAQARKLGVPFLGEIPLAMRLRASADSGRPLVDAEPESELAGALLSVATAVRERLFPDRPATASGPDAAGSLFDRFRKVWSASDAD